MIIFVTIVFSFANQQSFGQVTWKTFDEQNGLFSIQIPSNWFAEVVPETEKLGPIDHIFRYAGDSNRFAWVELIISNSTYINTQAVAESYISYYEQFDDFRLLEPVSCEKYRLNDMFTCSVLSSQQLEGEPRRNVLNLVSLSPNGTLYEILFIASSNIYSAFLPAGQFIIDSLEIDFQKVAQKLTTESMMSSDSTIAPTANPAMNMQNEIPLIPPTESPSQSSSQQEQNQQQEPKELTHNNSLQSQAFPIQERINNTFNDPVVGISFKYPTDWTIISQRYSGAMLNAEQIPDSITPIVRLVDNSMDGASFLVLVEKLPIPMSSDLYYELNKKSVENEPTMSMVSESGTPIAVGGINGIKYELNVNNISYNQTQIALSDGTTGYIIAYKQGSSQPVKQLSDINYMLDTFEFK